jgi:CRP-like cAMP-binding protein
LARVLLNLTKHYGTQTAAGVAISLKLSQEELGNLVGVSRESVNRQIRIWVEADVLEYTQGTLIIKKLDALVRDSHSTER